MRPLRLTVFLLLSICSLRVQLHAQKDASCDAPAPISGQTKQQQAAATSGALAACKAAMAPDAHPLKAEEPATDTKSAGQVDDAIDAEVLALPADPATWKVDDYLEWLRQKGCPKLRQQAKDKVADLSPDSQKDYLARMVLVLKKKSKCN